MDKIFVLDKKYFVLDKTILSGTNLILSRTKNILSGQMDRALVVLKLRKREICDAYFLRHTLQASVSAALDSSGHR